MFLNLGGNISVRKKDIIGVFDMDNLPADSQVMEFLKENEKNNNVKVVGMGIPKAIVVTNDGNTTSVYITTISSSSVKGRFEQKYVKSEM